MIAPYATALALMVAPEAACANLQTPRGRGLRRARTASTRRSTTRRRACRAARPAPSIRSFMAHHQGMSLLSLAYLLLDRPMQRRFAVRPAVPGDDAAAAGARAQGRGRSIRALAEVSDSRAGRRRRRRRRCASSPTPDTPIAGSAAAVQRPLPRDGHQRGRRLQPLEGPGRHALARGRHARQLGHVLLPARRWRAATFWSTAYQPTLEPPDSYEAIFSEAAPSSAAATTDFDTHTEIGVSPEDDIELRRVTHHQPLAHARGPSR